jgi:hypothetical protein
MPIRTGPPAALPGSQEERAGIAQRTEARLDEFAQRFDKTDWIEFGAALLLALTTIMAAWTAYQATRWVGVQANAFSAAGAARTEAAQATTVFESQRQSDAQLWTLWLDQAANSDEDGMAFVERHFADEFKPAFDAWLAQVPAGELAEGPFDLEEYSPQAEALADELNAQADALAAEAREANQIGDNFVLTAVIMASVLLFAGVGAKFKRRGVRIMMLLIATFVFASGVLFTFSLPQNIAV